MIAFNTFLGILINKYNYYRLIYKYTDFYLGFLMEIIDNNVLSNDRKRNYSERDVMRVVSS